MGSKTDCSCLKRSCIKCKLKKKDYSSYRDPPSPPASSHTCRCSSSNCECKSEKNANVLEPKLERKLEPPPPFQFDFKPFCDCKPSCACPECPDVLQRLGIKITEKACEFENSVEPTHASCTVGAYKLTPSLLDVVRQPDCACRTVAKAIKSGVSKNLGLHEYRDKMNKCVGKTSSKQDPKDQDMMHEYIDKINKSGEKMTSKQDPKDQGTSK